MRKLLIFSFVLTLAGCSLFGKDDDVFQGEISARMNGQAWPDSSRYALGNAQISSSVEEGVWILLNTYNQQGLVRETIEFPHLPKPVERYQLARTYIFVGEERSTWPYRTVVDNGDVGGDRYWIDETADNYVTIIAYDSTAGRVTGTFAFTAIIDTTVRSSMLSASPDTIRFTEGRFELPLVDRDALRQ